MTLLLDKLTVYGEMLEAVMAMLPTEGDAVQLPELRRQLFPLGSNPTTERELLDYLTHTGLAALDYGGENLRAVWRDSSGVRLHLLRWLRQARDENGVVLAFYRFLLEERVSARRVLERDEVWPAFNRARKDSRDGVSVVALNGPKTASWLRLLSFIGLVRPERSNSFVLFPSLALAKALVTWGGCRMPEGQKEVLSLARWVEAVEQEWCPVTTGPGILHAGWADALECLSQRGVLAFQMHGDAAGVLVNGRLVSHVRLIAQSGVDDASPTATVD